MSVPTSATNINTSQIKSAVNFKMLDEIRVNLSRSIIFNSHRSGWKYAIQSLMPIRDDENGIYIDDFIERDFSWNIAPDGEKEVSYEGDTWIVKYRDIRVCPDTADKQKTHAILHPRGFVLRWSTLDQKWMPYDQSWDNLLSAFKNDDGYKFPWIGFWHNPSDPRAYISSVDISHSPHNVANRSSFVSSLKQCKGIVVLSNTMAQWVKYKLRKMGYGHIPVSMLYHPTEPVTKSKRFSYSAFVANKRRRIIQIGHWLRDMSAIWRIRNPTDMTKTFLYGDKYALKRFLTEECLEKQPDVKKILGEILSDESSKSRMVKMLNQCVDIMRVSDDDYDEMLSCNIVFVRLMGSSCNNTIIECMTRGTPLLINRLDAVEEYLGKNYPFYYNTFEEASQKLTNTNLIKLTSEYLNSWSLTNKMTGVNFLSDFCNCNIMRSLVDMPQLTPTVPKFDFVVTWVNNNDSSWQCAFYRDLNAFNDKHRPFCKFLPHNEILAPDSITPNRYRSQFDELKYCLRAIESCCWQYIRRLIIIVHDDQKLPSWLNTTVNNVRIIRHKELFTMAECPKSSPSYNSLAIEACIPMIPDLTETFIYLNDDTFLLGRWTDEDFISNGKMLFYQDLYETGRNDIKYSFEHLWKNNHKILDSEIVPLSRPVLQHAPYIISKNQCMKYKWNSLINTRKSRFRTINDIGLLCGVSQYMAHHEGKAVPARINVCHLKPQELALGIHMVPPEARVLCIQDDDVEGLTPEIKIGIIQVLDKLYPDLSDYEVATNES